MAARGVWALVGALAIAGCAPPYPRNVYVTEGFASPETAYGRALDRYTRKAELYRGVDTVAKGWATWRAPALREALVETSVRAYHLEGEEAAALRREEERASRRVREFHLALYTPEADWNDLASADTLWRPYLVLPGGERLEPVRVIRLSKTGKNPVEYPYVTPWTREYSLFFPLLAGPERYEELTLVLSGPLGTLRFRY